MITGNVLSDSKLNERLFFYFFFGRIAKWKTFSDFGLAKLCDSKKLNQMAIDPFFLLLKKSYCYRSYKYMYSIKFINKEYTKYKICVTVRTVYINYSNY